MSEIRYLKITLVDGTRFILRVTRESPGFIHGFEVNAEGDEVVPVGYERRHRTLDRGLVKKAVDLRMSKKYATLVPLGEAHATARKSAAQLDAEIAEALRAKDAALRASEAAKRLSDDVYDAAEHRAAAKAHQRAMRLHKSDPVGAGAAWLHDLAAINHKQAATARASRALKATDPARTRKTFAAFQEKLSAANEHTTMAQEYARQALAAARKRV